MILRNQGKQAPGVVNKEESSTEYSISCSKADGISNEMIYDYCKALPDSKEWQEYQIKRVISLKELKNKNLKNVKLKKQDLASVTKKVNTKGVYMSLDGLEPNIGTANEMANTSNTLATSEIPAILKNVRNKVPSKSQSKDTTSNVTWKEPLADTKFLPVGWMKVPEVPQLHQTCSQEKCKIKKKTTLVSTVSNVKRKSSTAADNQNSILNTTEKQEKIIAKKGKSHKRNNGKNNPNKSTSSTAIESVDMSSEVKAVAKRGNSRSKIGETNKKPLRAPKKVVNGISSEIKPQTRAPTKPSESLYSTTVAGIIDAHDDTPAKSFLPFQQQTENKSKSSSKETEVSTSLGSRHNQAISTDNNNNYWNAFFISKGMEVISSSNVADRDGKAFNLAREILPGSAETKLECEETNSQGVNEAFYSIPQQDLNGNTIVDVPTQKRTWKAAGENNKEFHKMESKEETLKNGGGSVDFYNNTSSYSENLSMNVLDRKNNTNKLNFFGGNVNTVNQLKYGPAAIHSNSHLISMKPLERDTNVNIRQSSRFNKIQIEKMDKLLKFDVTDGELFTRLKPPKLPEIEVCNVVPGTPEWHTYWTDFNKKMGEYYTCVESYAKQLDDLLVDEDSKEYNNELVRRRQEEEGLKICMGITMPKPPIMRQPLKDTVEIGGYMIRPLGGAVHEANITTCDHSSFRLEILCDKIESHLSTINVDTKCNIMTIAIPSGQKPKTCIKIVQISVPPYKKVQNLEIGNPLYNGGKIVISGK